MPADKKTKKVGSIHHKGADMRVDLNLDRDSMLFWADVSGERIEHKEGKEVERLALEAIERSLDLPWTPIIAVHPWGSASSSDGEQFGFKVQRIYVANLPGGVGWRETQWHAKDNKQRLAWSGPFAWRVTDGEFKPPCVRHGFSGSHSYYLPYDDAVWNRLTWIQSQLKRIREEFLAMLEDPQGAALLAEMRIPLPLALPEVAETTINDWAQQQAH